MSSPLGARKEAAFLTVSKAPSINLTPVGPSQVPVGYPVVSDLADSIGTVANVRFNGNPAYVMDQSSQPTCKGDDAGTGKGVRSGTVNGEVKPTGGSSTVRINGKPLVREGDPCTMQGGNCVGIYVTQPAPGCTISGGKPTQPTSPPLGPETPAEQEVFRQWLANIPASLLDSIGKGIPVNEAQEGGDRIPIVLLIALGGAGLAKDGLKGQVNRAGESVGHSPAEMTQRVNVFNNQFPNDALGVPRLIPKTKLASGNGIYNYVVMEDGSLRIGAKVNQVGGGHIDLAGGKAVVAAGEVKVLQGKIRWIDNSSGHYLPKGERAKSAAENAFIKEGFSVSNDTYIEKSWVPDPTSKNGGKWR